MVDVHKLIAAISPNVFCEPEVRSKVKKIAKEEGFLKAAEVAKPIKESDMFEYYKSRKDPFKKWGLKAPVEKHQIKYDSPTEGLEPIYFWLLDFANGAYGDVKKLTDNFSSSVGSGHFSEQQGKATRMQEEGMKMLGAVNQVMRSILNIVYDLKEFKIRLEVYDKAKSSNPIEKNAALLGLKQIWLDQVDAIKRQTTSIKGMAQQFDYVTLIDAFMASNSLDDIKKLDLNDRVKRILEQRIPEFFSWISESEKELRKRYSIERSYLRSQYNTVQLYSRWIKPYLKAARELEQNTSRPENLVSAFNTMNLELTLFAKGKYDPSDDVSEGVLPETFKTITKRKYSPVLVIEFKFRSIPQKVGQHYAFGGQTSVEFTSYALNEDEIKVFHQEIEKDDFGEVMKLIHGATDESLDVVKKDIEDFLKEDEKEEGDKKKQEEKKKEQDVNPFSSLFSFMKKPEKNDKGKKDKEIKEIKSDNEYEKIIRSQAIMESREKCWTIFDIYKRAHGMMAYINPFEKFS